MFLERSHERQDSQTKAIALLLSIVVGVVLAVVLYGCRIWGDVESISNYIVTFTSFTISISALLFAIVTYYSIDSVDKISAMDGNALENEEYSIAYHEEIIKYAPARDADEFTGLLLDGAMPDESYSTCIEYADHLQRVVDSLVWFAYVTNDQGTNERIRVLCRKLRAPFEGAFTDMSSGVCNLLSENLKLIEAVLGYQRVRNGANTMLSSLEDVRGGVLKNPVSKTVYYDYLGLHYRRLASQVMNPGLDGDEFSEGNMRKAADGNRDEDTSRHCEILSDRARWCFMQAEKVSGDNLLWISYISYNMMRVRIMIYLLHAREMPAGEGLELRGQIACGLDEMVRNREEAEYLFCGSRKRSAVAAESYLEARLRAETDLARKLRDSFASAFPG